jgi:hypothetical protein
VNVANGKWSAAKPPRSRFLCASGKLSANTQLFPGLFSAWYGTLTAEYGDGIEIDLIKPENCERLLADLRERTGLLVTHCEVGCIDFLRDRVSTYVNEGVTEGD